MQSAPFHSTWLSIILSLIRSVKIFHIFYVSEVFPSKL